jgi:hypothetical protein
MTTKTADQRGSSVITLVAAVVLVIGLAGWGIYQHSQKSSTTADASASNDKQQQQVDKPQQPATTYLSVGEWGIKVPLADSIKDAYYTVSGSNKGDDGLANTAWVSLTSLNDKGCNIGTTGPSSSASPIGSIIRVLPTDTDPVTGAKYTEQDPNGSTVNGYYYTFIPWKNTSCAPASTLQSINAAFESASKSITVTTSN